VVEVEDPWGRPVDPQKLDEALSANPGAKLVGFVHGETSTGVLSDARVLVEVARGHGALTVVDTVASLGGVEVDVDGWGADAVYSGSQKCLSCAPGLSPITFGERARDAVRSRKTPVASWFLDLTAVMTYWEATDGRRSYHHTAPVNALYGLHEALVMHREEGRESAWERHLQCHRRLAAGLEELGLRLTVDEACRMPQLNVVAVPEGVDDAATRRRLLDEYDLEIGAGLGPLAGRIWRIGIMGHSAVARNVHHCVGALRDLLKPRG
jgi:alanine-glyoxylate transaminase/serine-glyoxylate transaminase/serine-pyruvate transaminase